MLFPPWVKRISSNKPDLLEAHFCWSRSHALFYPLFACFLRFNSPCRTFPVSLRFNSPCRTFPVSCFCRMGWRWRIVPPLQSRKETTLTKADTVDYTLTWLTSKLFKTFPKWSKFSMTRVLGFRIIPSTNSRSCWGFSKAAMTEQMADPTTNLPNEKLMEVYKARAGRSRASAGVFFFFRGNSLIGIGYYFAG